MRLIKAFFLCVTLALCAAPHLAAVEKITIAIMNFNVTNLPQPEVDLLIDFFNNALFETGVFDVVQRDKRDKLMQEIEFSLSDAADSKKTRELGRLLSVKLVVFGSVGRLGKNVLFNITMVDVDTGRIIGTFSHTYKALEEIAEELPRVSSYVAEAAAKTMFRKKTNVLFYDDFSNKRWHVSEKLFYENGEYNIFSKKQNWYVWETHIVDDFAYECQAKYVKGDNNGGYGMVFRLQDENNFYAFWITNTGYYKVSKTVAGKYTDVVTWTRHNAININGINVLKVEAIGTHFNFIINKLKVKEINDNTFRAGKFGLYAFQNVQAAFSRMIVYQGDLIFYDYFSVPSENWSEGAGAFTKDGKYIVDAESQKQDYYTWSSEIYKDISLKTEVAWLSGSANTGYGIVFRFNDTNNHYIFIITKNGYYRFGYYKDNKWTTLVDWKRSRMLNAEGKNILRVECVGETYALYINDNLVDTITDNTFLKGKIGFVAFKGVHVAYDNVELFSLE